MKTNITNTVSRLALLAVAGGFSSCASVQHPLARHDMDGDGAISDSEYRQNGMQYSLAGVQRQDEYQRGRLATAHMSNAADFIGQLDRGLTSLGNLGR
jgi:hypothetical protein